MHGNSELGGVARRSEAQKSAQAAAPDEESVSANRASVIRLLRAGERGEPRALEKRTHRHDDLVVRGL